MNIAITGANGFIGKNLSLRLSEIDGMNIFPIVRNQSEEELRFIIHQIDAIVHLAGENRPVNQDNFYISNVQFTEKICELLKAQDRKITIIYSSSSQVLEDNPYGKTKLLAEKIIEDCAYEKKNVVHIFRFPGIFGKWARPNYNSVVANFCHNVINNLPIAIENPDKLLRLLHIDDVCNLIIEALNKESQAFIKNQFDNEYVVSVGDLAKRVLEFRDGRINFSIPKVGKCFDRVLYATYISYLPKEKFSYPLAAKSDHRGSFVEVLKTIDSGQFSFLTINPKATRGGHYHHTKTEKFIVLNGQAKFRFRNILTSELYELMTTGDLYEVVETVPGWTHDITNIGLEKMLVLLWSNEVFNSLAPDTIQSKV